jgi:hypothetical protein
LTSKDSKLIAIILVALPGQLDWLKLNWAYLLALAVIIVIGVVLVYESAARHLSPDWNTIRVHSK